jgi:SHS2 domain-containing protein
MMTSLGQVAPQESVAIEFEEADAEFALVTWLNLPLRRGPREDRGRREDAVHPD